MKKLILLFILSLSMVTAYGQNKKDIVIIEADSTKTSYTITIKENKKDKFSFDLNIEGHRAILKSELELFYKKIEKKEVTATVELTKITIEKKESIIYDLKDEKAKIFFTEKLKVFYNHQDKLSLLEERIKMLENEEKSKAVIGVLKFYMNKEIPIYEISKKKKALLFNEFQLQETDKTIKLDSIFIHIKNGSIYEVLAMSGNNVYHANDYPITLENLLSKKNQKISKRAYEVKKISFMASESGRILNNAIKTHISKESPSNINAKNINQDLRIKKRIEKRAYKIRNINNHNEYFKLEDIVNYSPIVNKHFIPKDTVIKVKESGVQTKYINKSVYLNSYIESAIYTDLFSLLGDEANGLIQTEFSSKFNLNVKSLAGYYGYFFKYIKPKIKYSKFDKGFDMVETTNDSISYTKLLRQSYLDLGLQLNLFQGELGNRFESDISVGSNYYSAKIKNNENDDIAANMFAIYAKTSLLVREYHNFGLTGSLKITKLFKPKFPNNTSYSNIPLSNNNYWFLTPEFEMYYYPQKNKESKVFVRFQYVMNSIKDDGDFLKLQFGYKIPIKLKQK